MACLFAKVKEVIAVGGPCLHQIRLSPAGAAHVLPRQLPRFIMFGNDPDTVMHVPRTQ